MAVAPVTATQIGAVNSTLLPPEITGPIFAKATEQSAVMSLARRVPLSVTAQTAIPVPMDVPVAGWVVEGGQKPVSSSGVTIKTMSGKKVAVMVAVSQEVADSNPGALYTQLQQDLPTAIARAFDRAAIHGTNHDGTAGPFADYLLKNAQTINLSDVSGTPARNVYTNLVRAEQLVTDDNWDFSGWVGDPRLRSQLKLALDTTGRPLYLPSDGQGFSVGGLGGTLNGFPIAYNRGVSGKVRRDADSVDSGLRAVGGDFSQCAYGVGMELTVKRSVEANYQDSDGNWHSAFQENLVLILAEAYYGFVANDVVPAGFSNAGDATNAFVGLTASSTLTS